MEPLFDAVLESDQDVARLLRADASACRTRATRDRLITSIPHWLYAGDTALHLAAAALRMQPARALLDAGADPNARNRRGATPLHYACDPRPNTSGTWGPTTQAALIALLVRHGAEIDGADRGGATALHRAVRGRSAAAVRQLLALGARPDCKLGKRATSPLHLAMQSTGAGGTAGTHDAQLEIVRLLLDSGADPDAADANGRTARDWARNETLAGALGKPASRKRRRAPSA